MAEYKVVKIGWENANEIGNIVLVSKADRTMLGCDRHSPVYVKKGEKKLVAIVEIQFREFVGQECVCTLNRKTAEALNVNVGDTVDIDSGVTESDWAAYWASIARMMGGTIVRAGQNGN